MIDRLRSHLKSEKGFTLIELLVVIAIIAILVVIVLVALNPLQRIQDANNRSAASRVRQAAIGVETCLTRELQTVDAATAAANCAVEADLVTNGDLKSVPADTEIEENGTAVCVWNSTPVGNSNVWAYKTEEGGGTEAAGETFDTGVNTPPADCAAVLAL